MKPGKQDYKRIDDFITGNVSDGYVMRMARKITDKDKCLRRETAAYDRGHPSWGIIYRERYDFLCNNAAMKKATSLDTTEEVKPYVVLTEQDRILRLQQCIANIIKETL